MYSIIELPVVTLKLFRYMQSQNYAPTNLSFEIYENEVPYFI